MTSTQVLSDFASALASGAVEVVDLTAPLGPETPLIKLPPADRQEYPAGRDSPHLELRQGWAVLGLELAEARRTFRHAFRRAEPLDLRQGLQGRRHRHHPGEEFRGAGLRDRLLGADREESRLPVDGRRRQSLGEGARRYPGRLVGFDAHRLVQAQRQRSKIPQCRRQGAAFTRSGGRDHPLSGREGGHRLGVRDASVPMPAPRAAWTRRSRRTPSCTKPTVTASPASASSTSCRRRAPS